MNNEIKFDEKISAILSQLDVAIQPERVFSVVGLCALLGVSKPTLYDEINSGRLRTYTLGTRRFATCDAVREWQKDRERETRAQE